MLKEEASRGQGFFQRLFSTLDAYSSCNQACESVKTERVWSSARQARGLTQRAEMNLEWKRSILAAALVVALGAGVHAQSSAPDTVVKVDPAKGVEVGSQLIKIKKGSIADVDAVGHREIGGSRWSNWYSATTEADLGRIYSQEVEQSVKLISDPVVQEYVNRIGQKLVSNSDCKVPFTIKVIDAEEINAMALPGGFFYVNSGLLLNADTEAELAGAMAHEIAHVCAHHFARQMTRTNMAQVGMAPAMVLVGGWASLGIAGSAQLALPASCLQFSRELETQADYLGVQYMYRAGYDPRALITYFEKIQALEKRKPGLVSKAFNQHPQTPERIQRSQQEITQILPARAAYIVSTSEFDDVKSRLARIESKRSLNDSKGETLPSLPKPSPGSVSSGNNPTDDQNSGPGK
jgi:predicted Zn-dependent protease